MLSCLLVENAHYLHLLGITYNFLYKVTLFLVNSILLDKLGVSVQQPCLLAVWRERERERESERERERERER